MRSPLQAWNTFATHRWGLPAPTFGWVRRGTGTPRRYVAWGPLHRRRVVRLWPTPWHQWEPWR